MDLPAYYTFTPRPDQPERYDQQTAFYDSQSTGVIWFIGGNGAGTSETALAKVARFLLTTTPPRKDTPFWIISDTYEQVCNACWKEKLSPNGHGHIPRSEVDWERISWYKPNLEWPFEVPLREWPGRPGKNWSLVFKSYMQGRAKMQAQAIGGFLFVEQFPWGILEEVLRGCREYSFPGAKLCEFTPVDPSLSVEIETLIEEDRLPPGWEVYRANTECAMEAGHVTRDWFDQFFGMVSDEIRETRLTGRFATYEGAIYGSFNPAIHVIDEDDIEFPPGVHYRRGIDWGAGPSNAFCCLWAYRNGLGQWFFFDEYYSTDQEKTTIDHLCEVQDRFSWPRNNPYYGVTWADPSSPDHLRIASRFSNYRPDYDDLSIQSARNAVYEGIEHVRSLLKLQIPDDDGETKQPKLFISRQGCPNLARQMRTYRWLSAAETGLNPRDARPEPLKKNDHAVDAARYLLFSEAVQTGNTPQSMDRPRGDRQGILPSRRGSGRRGVRLEGGRR